MHAKTYDFYILAGQSNMEGLGLVTDLPDSLSGIHNGVFIYHPNRLQDNASPEDIGYWEELRPGHGAGFMTDGMHSFYSDKFGPELSFAIEMKKLSPTRNIAIFKYAKGGASIHPEAAGDWGCWYPDSGSDVGINQWDHFKHQLRRALSVEDIDGDGEPDTLVPAGILWLQGESDASFTRAIAESYTDNLSFLIRSIRDAAGKPLLPVVVCRISESNLGENGTVLTWGPIIQSAQEKFVELDPHAALIRPPDNHGWLDPWHYDSQAYLELGVRFAEAMYGLQRSE